MDNETPNSERDRPGSATPYYEVPSTTPSFSDFQMGLYAISAVVGGFFAFWGQEKQFWLWLLPLSILALPWAVKQSLRGQGGVPDAPRSYSRLRMWILGCFGGLILGKGLSVRYWPTVLVGTAYVVWAFRSGRSTEIDQGSARGVKG